MDDGGAVRGIVSWLWSHPGLACMVGWGALVQRVVTGEARVLVVDQAEQDGMNGYGRWC